MSVLFLESFNHMTEALLNDNRWSSLNIESIGTGYARFSGNGTSLRYDYQHLTYALTYSLSTVVLGFAMKIAEGGNPDKSNNSPWLRFSNAAGDSHVEMHVNDNYQIGVYRGEATPILLVNSTKRLLPFKWYFIEVKPVIHATGGSIEVRVNGDTWISASGLNTYVGSGDSTIGRIKIACVHEHTSVTCLVTYYDDIYIDSSNFLGDVQMGSAVPDSVGTNNDFTASTGNKNECVDEPTSHNSDTDYIYSASVGNKQTFGFTVGSVGNIKALQLTNACKKSDASFKEMRGVCRSGGTLYYGSELTLTEAYQFNQNIWANDPGGGSWDQSKIEAAEFGLDIYS